MQQQEEESLLETEAAAAPVLEPRFPLRWTWSWPRCGVVVEASASGEGFDGPFVIGDGEAVEAALGRQADAGRARLWVATDSELALRLKNMGFLAETCFPER